MDNIDKLISDIVNKEVNIPNGYKNCKKNFLKYKKQRRGLEIYKPAVASCIGIIMTTGVVFAGYTSYQKIWKNPTKVNSYEVSQSENEIINNNIIEQEKSKYISEGSAKDSANKILTELGYANDKVTEINLQKGYNDNNVYIAKTINGTYLCINPENSNFEGLTNYTVLQDKEKADKIDKTEAIKIAENTYNKINVNINSLRYDVFDAKESNYNYNNITNQVWNVKFAKKYNDTLNKNDYYSVTFVVRNGITYYISVTGNVSDNFENNSILVSEDEAIKIATEKENKFTSLAISNVKASTSIEKMNLFIYCLENNIDNNDRAYQVEDITRNVWVVEIEHNKETPIRDYSVKAVKEMYNKKYYIDATTGEIIGGEQAELLQN